MQGPSTFYPGEIFSREEGENFNVPRAIIAPQRYLQGPDVLDHLGRYLAIVPSKTPSILISPGGRKRLGKRLAAALEKSNITWTFVEFDGECCDEEIERMTVQLVNTETTGHKADCVIAVGGGKCVDAGKCLAHRLAVPYVICPTIASNDAPCSAVSVVYTRDGVFKRPEMFAQSPSLVVVDTKVIVNAPLRHFVAGIGDAMATFFEARSCNNNPLARNHIGTRPTASVIALAGFCRETLFKFGGQAVEDVRRSQLTEAVELVVEANTLLSGMGFESGGLGVAHGIASALTTMPKVDKNYFHGEMVAIGVLAHLAYEDRQAELDAVMAFFASVDLPIHLGQLSIDLRADAQAVDGVIAAAMMFPFIQSTDPEICSEKLKNALFRAHDLGIKYAREHLL